ncbi:hypothetical protein [Natronobacterium gregoryi]|nr:hypothetical protein [Natronobacterium gregoryi]AFZ74540.1 hypothetical protein Natgr_3421 [Natronobacterium gregoryi SP2]PLK21802.1 hypothetical protein CYV19_02445 [Natronobacterium gregoryi SP2]SFI96799.1 hypothetical protein SAMN05443661_110166 [Natronobacterium gregoryi]
MSTTAHALGEVQGRDEPDRVFRRYVFNNPETCSNCFRTIKSDHVRICHGTLGHDVEPKATRAKSVRRHPTDDDEIGPEGICIGTEQVEITTKARYPTRTICEDCGSVAGRADSNPLSRREALSRAENVAERLHELGEPVDIDQLKHAVGHLKSLEEFASYDTEVFEAATTVCVKRARTRL